MTRTTGLIPPAKTKMNACPVCGKARGKGSPYELTHGPCMEKLAQAAKQRKEDQENWTNKFSEDNKIRARDRAGRIQYSDPRKLNAMLKRMGID